MKPFYVYILKCKDGSYYVGHTDNLEKRIAEHNDKAYPCYTSKHLPVELVYTQDFSGRDEALEAEHQIKKWTRKKKEALINKNWNNLKILSKKKFDE